MAGVLGIDPGLDGAIAYVAGDGEAHVWDTPTGPGPKGKRVYLVQRMVDRIAQLKHLVVIAGLEKVHAMPGQGVASMWKMGYGVGVWVGILAALGIIRQEVAPQTWQKVMVPDRSLGKESHRLQAVALFPSAASQLTRKKDHGRADALLIAGYLQRATGLVPA